MTMRKKAFHLLQVWCDELLRRQLTGSGIAALDGGIYCSACAGVHGRSADAVYPLLYLADTTGEARYLDGAKRLMAWSDCLRCTDGSYYNDHNSAWCGTTVFFAIALCNALGKHGKILDTDTRAAWDSRLRGMADWLWEKLNTTVDANVNYFVTNAAALALCGAYFSHAPYTERAREWAVYALARLGTDGLLYGEGHPIDAQSPKGCHAVDIGYNVEESLPMLAVYAHTAGDEAALQTVRESIHAHLAFLLPDGGWDNSMGTRNFKWSYWGSRTSDGFQEAAAVLGADDPWILDAAYRNLLQYEACTKDGLLRGGPHYAAHGEPGCTHHSFCHAKALAALLDADLPEPSPDFCPPEAPVLRYFSELDSHKIHCGGYYATVTGYDFHYTHGGHASGGTLCLLWHEKTGSLIASSMTDYALREPLNQQLPLRKDNHRSLTPRIESADGKWRQCDDYHAQICSEQAGDTVRISVKAKLCGYDYTPAETNADCALDYTFSPGGIQIRGRCTMPGARYVLPLIGLAQSGCTFTPGAFSYPLQDGTVQLRSKNLKTAPQDIFFLSGGFEVWEVVLESDADGAFACEITVM